MKEQYINEMSQVHAPKELIDKTKLAMQAVAGSEGIQAEAFQKKTNIKILRYIPVVTAAAAAIMLFFLIPGFGTQKNVVDEQQGEKENFIQSELLLEQLDLTPDKLSPGASQLQNIETYIIEHYPEEFLGATALEKEIETIPVKIIKDEKTGFYKAVFTWKQDKILVMSELVEQEHIVNSVKAVIQALAEQTKE